MTSTLRTPTARTIARIVSMVLAVSMLCSCAASAKKKQADLAGQEWPARRNDHARSTRRTFQCVRGSLLHPDHQRKRKGDAR